ncbi:hypothetical protein GCM10025875_10080 [Litorihabitans aurantiacus]|uniref:Uncharacterized protein n=1 Tax=Litorihabitans aurantiacus TaxID=1930061 RepID=A0AA37UQ60_9MICO|nr:hypothetical protein GCM10025875_10080 [Litorihabitans aurantiacus]
MERTRDLQRDHARLRGGSAASAASTSCDPAATTCPAPLTLAGQAPARSIAASTSSGSPPSRAVMPDGFAAAACAIARARAETRATAELASNSPATLAAANSPTE